MEEPYLSFVIIGRNDNYGGDFLDRLNSFVRNVVVLCEKTGLACELLIVEWNPPADKPSLRRAIRWPDIERRFCRIKIITVPDSIHSQFSNPSGWGLLESKARNTGARRARGKYVLVTNPDVLFNEQLISFFAKKQLSDNSFYRIDRHDVKTPIPDGLSVEEELEYCSGNIIRVFHFNYETAREYGKPGNLYRRSRGFLGRLKRRIMLFPFGPVHANASGDFFLMHRNCWERIRGFPEIDVEGKPYGIDTLISYQALFSKLRQVVLKEPLRLYHQDHGRCEKKKVASAAFRETMNKLLATRRPVVFNDESWGLGDRQLQEYTVPCEVAVPDNA